MYAKSLETIETILAAAGALFVAKNYADVTISAIAREAGVSKGALYHHFDTKERLYQVLMLNTLETVEAHHIQSLEHVAGSCRERMRQSLLSFFQLPAQTHQLLQLVRRDINVFSGTTRDALVRAYQQAVPEHVEKLVRAGIAAGEIAEFDARLLSWLHVAMVEVALQPYSKTLIGSDEARADFLIGMFFEGVGQPAKEKDPRDVKLPQEVS